VLFSYDKELKISILKTLLFRPKPHEKHEKGTSPFKTENKSQHNLTQNKVHNSRIKTIRVKTHTAK